MIRNNIIIITLIFYPCTILTFLCFSFNHDYFVWFSFYFLFQILINNTNVIIVLNSMLIKIILQCIHLITILKFLIILKYCYYIKIYYNIAYTARTWEII